MFELYPFCCSAGSSARKQGTSILLLQLCWLDICAVLILHPFVLELLQKKGQSEDTGANDDLQTELFQLCTRDGTPEQARNAVYTLARLLHPGDKDNVSSPDASNATDKEAFSPLLKALTSPRRLVLSSSDKESSKLVSVLSALSAFSDCAPSFFGSSERGDKAIKFALETVLMGVNHAGDDDDDGSAASDNEDGDEADSPRSRKKRPRSASKNKTKHLSPEGLGSLLEDESLSLACRRICAAIDFLVSYIRSTALERKRGGSSSGAAPVSLASSEQVKQVFELLTQILRDKGLPPSNRDRRACKARQDRAALRQCVAVHLFRLCDARLGLEKTHLTTGMWHTLSEALLDEERVVREAVMEELSLMLSGSGIYGFEGSRLQPQPPALRFSALVVLCTDGDHGADHAGANGNAANVGKLATRTKSAAQKGVADMRKACNDFYTQCRAMGKAAEQKFENNVKKSLMPEYMVPYAFHILAFRRETPSAGGIGASAPQESEEPEQGDEDDDLEDAPTADEESQQRVLRKRLKFLFEPLVQSLGDTADNISFLLRMAETLGKLYTPTSAFPSHGKAASSPLRLSLGSETSADSQPVAQAGDERAKLLEAKLKSICAAAREVLLSFVKKDVNLTTYPGIIHVMNSLFTKSSGPTLRMSQQSEASSLSPTGLRQPILRSPKPTSWTPSNRRENAGQTGTAERKSRVHFSPELQVPSMAHETSISVVESSNHGFDGLSPIAKSQSPVPVAQRRSSRTQSIAASSTSADTLGTTPPSVLRGATMRSTAPDEGGTDEESPGSKADSKADSKTSSPVVQSEIRRSIGSDDSGLVFDDDNDEAIKTTSETQSTGETSARETRSSRSSSSSPRKRKSPTQESNVRASLESQSQSKDSSSKKSTAKVSKKAKKGAVPLQIKINRSKPMAKSSSNSVGGKKKKKRGASQADELDFDFGDDTAPENKPVGRNRSKKTKPSKTVVAKKTTASKSRSKGKKATPKETEPESAAPRRGRALRAHRT